MTICRCGHDDNEHIDGVDICYWEDCLCAKFTPAEALPQSLRKEQEQYAELAALRASREDC